MLEIRNLNKYYGKKKILDDINLNFRQGEMVALIGESGGGKTTLAKTIIGIEGFEEGNMMYKGMPLLPLKKRSFDACSDIQYIFQDPYSSLENHRTLKAELEEPIRICKRHNRNFLSIEESLTLVDPKIIPLLGKKISELSGGQRQKAAIARALIPNPKIIIADECTSMLDDDSSKDIFNSFNKIKNERKITLITIVHSIDFNSEYWDRIIVLKDGNVVDDEEFKSFICNAKSEYSKELIESYNYITQGGK